MFKDGSTTKAIRILSFIILEIRNKKIRRKSGNFQKSVRCLQILIGNYFVNKWIDKES